MPHPLTAASFRDLFGMHGNTCLSIYLPTAVGPGSAEANRIRYKNLLDEGEKSLQGRVPKHTVDAIMTPLRNLADGDFWTNAQHGLAVFGAERFHRHYPLTQEVEPLVVVSDSFHVRPLLRALESNRKYWLLGLSPRRIRVFRGTRDGLAAVEVPNLPRAMADAVHDEHQRRASGQGAGHETITKYYRAVGTALEDLLHGDDSPLVLAGQADAIDSFRASCRYGRLLDQAVVGTFEDEPLDRLHARAWTLVGADAVRREDAVLDKFGAEASHGRGSAELTTIARAVAQGRVKELLIADGQRLNGWFDVGTGEVRIDASPGQGDDLYDDLAEAVILRGGEVHGFPKTRMPSGVPIAALYRW